MAQLARVAAQGHLRLTGPAGGKGQSLSAPYFSSTGPQGGQLWAIWLGDNKAGLIFNMGETTEAQ